VEFAGDDVLVVIEVSAQVVQVSVQDGKRVGFRAAPRTCNRGRLCRLLVQAKTPAQDVPCLDSAWGRQ
jgi:hypothetical protein